MYLAIFNVWDWYHRAQERLLKEQLRINFVIRGRVENGSDCHAFQIAITFVPSFFREKKIKIKIKVQLQAERKQNVCSLCFKPRRGKTTLITAFWLLKQTMIMISGLVWRLVSDKQLLFLSENLF